MKFLTVHIAVLLFVIVRAGDLALSYVASRRGETNASPYARGLLWAILYGIVAILALIILILIIFGVIGGG